MMLKALMFVCMLLVAGGFFSIALASYSILAPNPVHIDWWLLFGLGGFLFVCSGACGIDVILRIVTARRGAISTLHSG